MPDLNEAPELDDLDDEVQPVAEPAVEAPAPEPEPEPAPAPAPRHAAEAPYERPKYPWEVSRANRVRRHRPADSE